MTDSVPEPLFKKGDKVRENRKGGRIPIDQIARDRCGIMIVTKDPEYNKEHHQWSYELNGGNIARLQNSLIPYTPPRFVVGDRFLLCDELPDMIVEINEGARWDEFEWDYLYHLDNDVYVTEKELLALSRPEEKRSVAPPRPDPPLPRVVKETECAPALGAKFAKNTMVIIDILPDHPMHITSDPEWNDSVKAWTYVIEDRLIVKEWHISKIPLASFSKGDTIWYHKASRFAAHFSHSGKIITDPIWNGDKHTWTYMVQCHDRDRLLYESEIGKTKEINAAT